MRLWDLPGARRFVDSICEALRDGSSVVVQFPGIVPDGFHEVVSAAVGNAFQSGYVSATNAPVRDIARRYVDDPDHVRRVPQLCDSIGFKDRLVLPQGLNSDSWPSLASFPE